MLTWLREKRHRLAHWLGWEPCKNETTTIDGVLHHWVFCVVCGQTVIHFTELRRRWHADV